MAADVAAPHAVDGCQAPRAAARRTGRGGAATLGGRPTPTSRP